MIVLMDPTLVAWKDSLKVIVEVRVDKLLKVRGLALIDVVIDKQSIKRSKC